MSRAAPSGSRTYRSELRAEQAEQTRRRILTSAAITFSERGYQATTMAQIARAARVSTESVKAAGSKAELLVRGFEVMFAGVEGADSLTESDAAAGVLELPDSELLASVIAVIAAANTASSRLWTVLLGASLSDALVDDALQVMLASRRRDYLALVTELARRGIADTDLDVDRAAAELSFLMSPESHQQLVEQSGWSDEDYRSWLVESVTRVVRSDQA